MGGMKEILRRMLTWTGRKFFPKRYWSSYVRKMISNRSERELALLPALISPGTASIDIGAADGLYSLHLLELGTNVIAFEPRPFQANSLSEMATTLGLALRVEAIALSNKPGTATLHILVKDLGRSTIEHANELDDPDQSPRNQLNVETRRLDDYAFQKVDLIKIDVEGHELAVLEGANETIIRSHCSIIVEAEDRHVKGSIGAIFKWMSAHEYAGFFLIDDVLHSADSFDLELHQNPENIGGWRSHWVRKGLYVNNFVFVPRERIASFFDRCRTLGFTTATNVLRER